MDEPLDDWYAREILTYEEALVRYLLRTWPNRDDIHDLRQETYVRVYEFAAKARPLAPKSFLFTTARNLMADRVRRRRIVSIDATGDIDVLNVSVNAISPEQIASARQELRRLDRRRRCEATPAGRNQSWPKDRKPPLIVAGRPDRPATPSVRVSASWHAPC